MFDDSKRASLASEADDGLDSASSLFSSLTSSLGDNPSGSLPHNSQEASECGSRLVSLIHSHPDCRTLSAVMPELSLAGKDTSIALEEINQSKHMTHMMKSEADKVVSLAKSCLSGRSSMASALDSARSDNVSLAKSRNQYANQAKLDNASIASLEGDLMNASEEGPASASVSEAPDDEETRDDIDDLKCHKKGYLRLLIAAKALHTHELTKIADLVQMPIPTAFSFSETLHRVTGEHPLSDDTMALLITMLKDTTSDTAGDYNDKLSKYVYHKEEKRH